jgi:hypothetical protein
MLKTVSAALLAASIIASPALAASSDKNAQAPTANTALTKQNAVGHKIKAQAKSGALNANAKMGKHQAKTVRHHRSRQQTGVLKTHRLNKVSTKHATPVTKRG